MFIGGGPTYLEDHRDYPKLLVVVPCAVGGATVDHRWTMAGDSPWGCDLAMLI